MRGDKNLTEMGTNCRIGESSWSSGRNSGQGGLGIEDFVFFFSQGVEQDYLVVLFQLCDSVKILQPLFTGSFLTCSM